ncbi:MAG: alanine--tRNA ligase [Oscillospiraceae bacterium]|nr:alanine--tRNA ligase [Oscillospiraceae bacterium]MDY4105186.1 alanine--tRNA ligase [Oscillospiraceae bacterium]
MAHKPYGLNELREMFLSFFETKGHLRLPSFSLIPQNDPSLLIINSGMAPMKPYFTGEVEPPRHRVCTCQKCVRTGDIENIGKTARHGTYFEMLGNFSFGDYFKHEALAWSWEFLTSPEWVGLEPELLYPSVYEKDDEAYDIWVNEIGVPADHVVRLGKDDNFWEHGSGPCGPCSEIYYDRGIEKGCGKPDCAPGCDCDRFMEVWNNVFSQFNNDGEGNYTDLIQKNIDTGMGLERLACVCQNVDSLFDVDTVMNITNKVSEITGATYGQSHKMDVSLRVITDHIRSATFMIGDGILPSNEGRGYVLRRLLRRAARHGKLLGVNEPFLYKVCDMVIHENKTAYPDLVEKQAYITRVIRVEEENFAKTIDTGLRILNELVESHKEKGETVFSGEDAFKLYDTYGFPLDLTQDILEEQGMTVDEEGFTRLMEEQKERARAARGDMSNAWQGLDLGLDNTPTRFTGYDHLEDDGTVLALVTEGEVSGVLKAGKEGIVVLDKTPFYAEMGGQTADHGTITCGTGVFRVTDVQKDKGGKFLHQGVMESGEIKVGDAVESKLDVERRQAIMRAHSATHLLDKALRKVLGDHVHQAGSLVEPDRLRFDFTHFSAMTAEELAAVALEINTAILAGYDVVTEELPIEEAKKKGAIALFGEKYGDIVRVVDMGEGYSVEFCGGTHLNNTAKVGMFHIEKEFSVASGVRRIEATVGMATLENMNRELEMLLDAAAAMKVKPTELREHILQMNEEMRSLRQTVEKYKAKETVGEADRVLFGAREVGGLKVITSVIPGADANKLRQMGDTLRDKEPSVVAVLASSNAEKITLLAVCGKEAVGKGVKAGELVKKVSGICGGSGGGKPDSAMGGGKDLLKLDDALAAVDDFVSEKLGL